MKSLDKKKVNKFPKFMYTIDGQHHYIDGRPVSLDEFIARDGFRKADKNKTKRVHKHISMLDTGLNLLTKIYIKENYVKET